jgi:protein TonB
MQPRFIAAAIVAACLLVASAVAEPDPATSNHSSDAVTFKTWAIRIQKELDRNLRYPSDLMGDYPRGGVVRVKFNCSDDGRPDKVTIARSSGNRLLDKAALHAVQRMASMHPLPASFAHDQKFAALIQFDGIGGPDGDLYQKKVLEEAARDNAWLDQPAIARAGTGREIVLAAR